MYKQVEALGNKHLFTVGWLVGWLYISVIEGAETWNWESLFHVHPRLVCMSVSQTYGSSSSCPEIWMSNPYILTFLSHFQQAWAFEFLHISCLSNIIKYARRRRWKRQVMSLCWSIKSERQSRWLKHVWLNFVVHIVI